MAFLDLQGVERLWQHIIAKLNTVVTIPSGLISLYSGAEVDIPEGWVICNGENGTPDLRDKFVIGAGNTYSIGSEGGEARHILTVNEMPSHSHAIKSDIDNEAYNQEWVPWTEYTSGWTNKPILLKLLLHIPNSLAAVKPTITYLLIMLYAIL